MSPLRSAAIGLAAGTAMLVGCQVIVPGDVPKFSCASSDPSACPSGMACDQGIGFCVTTGSIPEDGGDEAGEDIDAGGEGDQDAGPAALGADCSVDGDCKSKLCGTTSILTTSIVTGKGLCTQTCCTSKDCAAGFVCFGSGTGGNYCVEAAKAGRATPGAKTPGAPCVGHAECRSGLCTAQRCLDTCCLGSDCGSGTSCKITDVPAPAPAQTVWACSVPAAGSKDSGQSCAPAMHEQCKSNNCISSKCTPSCCSSASCTAQGFTDSVCAYGTGSELKWCIDKAATGTAAIGASCNDNFNCQSFYCEARRCALPCCRDADCPSGNACRPAPNGTPFLRCEPK